MNSPDTGKKLLDRWMLIHACLILRKDKIPYNTYRHLMKVLDNIHTKILSRKMSVPSYAEGISRILTDVSDKIHGRKDMFR